jgi:hypothetical protein
MIYDSSEARKTLILLASLEPITQGFLNVYETVREIIYFSRKDKS